MDTSTITVPLTKRQQQNLSQIREEFDLYRLNETLDNLFTYALDGLGGSCHAGDVAKDQYALAKIRQLIAIIMQPDLEDI